MDTNELSSSGEPKKYIRTLAGDMETLQKGGAPELTPLKTYEGDFSDKMKETNASPITVLAAEQDAAPEAPRPPEKPRSNLPYVVAGVALLIVGGLSVFFSYTWYQSKTAPVVVAPTISAPIFFDERAQISGEGSVLFQAIQQSLKQPLAQGTVRFLYTEEATTTDHSVFSALQIAVPQVLSRNIRAEDSMAGIVFVGGSPSPFFILSVASYGDTFSGMLSWEASMLRDLERLFPPYPAAPLIATTSTSSPQATTTKVTTATSSSPTMLAGFRDEVIGNHDVRMYRDAEGRSVLLYGYWNQTTLVIARSPEAFAEITDRLAISRTQR